MAARRRYTAEEAANIIDEDYSEVDSQSDSDLDDEVISDPNDSSDDDLIADLVEDIHHANQTFVSRGGVVWHRQSQAARGRFSAHNVIHERQGPTRLTLRSCGNSPFDAFSIFVTEDIIRTIVDCTNIEGNIQIQNWSPTDANEIRCFFGLLLLIGVYKGKNSSISELWSKSDGRPIFNSAMPRDRFYMLLRCIRFDIRANRNTLDKFAPIRNIFERIVTKFRSSFQAGANVTVDEQLVTFRGRCAFKMYLPSKPGKYGMKLWALVDSDTSYCLNLQPYLGRIGERDVGQSRRVVLELTDFISGTGRHITADNFFTSLELSRALLGRGLTYNGTIRKNKAEIPAQFLPHRARPVQSSLFGFTGDATLVSYVPKPSKAVILLSTLHRQPNVSEIQQKPEIIMDYNKYKGGVDTLDQLVRCYSCKRKTNRWPFAMFSNLLDICTYNAFVLYTSVHPQYQSSKPHRRRLFIIELAKSMLNISPPASTITPPVSQPAEVSSLKYVRCKFCPRSSDKKTRDKCASCGQSICKAHTITFCGHCADV